LSALTSLRTQAWQAAPALIIGPPAKTSTNSAVTAQFQAVGLDLSQALVVWEGRDLEPIFATNRLTCMPTNYGAQWLEAEAQWPDGRRAFGVASFFATNNLPTVSVVATVSNVVTGANVPGQFTFYRSDNTNQAVTVSFQLSGTAIKFNDYRTPQGDMPESVTIPAGATSLVLSILAVDHGAPQGRKSIVLTLSTNSGFNVGYPNTASLTISDNVRIASAHPAPGGGFTVTWGSLPGSVYQVMSKNNLSDPAWKTLSGNIVATSTTTSWTDTSTAGVPQRFYSVRLAMENAVPVVTLAPDPDGVTGMTLTWCSQAGVLYRVVCKNNLLEPRWTVLSPPITATSDTTSWTDFTTRGVPQRFYAVQALYPGPAQIVSIVGTPSRGITLTWSSLPGSLYEVVYKNSLGDPAWMPLSGNITAAAMLTSWTDYSAAGAPQRFYCVRTAR